MLQSSPTVMTLAVALAKAQAEISNPENSLVAVLPAEPGRPECRFRYASLASGLESRARRSASTRSQRSRPRRSTATAAPSSSPPFVGEDQQICCRSTARRP